MDLALTIAKDVGVHGNNGAIYWHLNGSCLPQN
jgi:hypothetical protein